MVLVLVRNQTRVSVTQIGRVSNVQSHSALVFWQTTLLKSAMEEVLAHNLTLAFATMVTLAQFAKHLYALVSWPIQPQFVMV